MIKFKSKISETNSLTNAILDYINFKGGFAIRINTSGIPIIANGKVISWRKSRSKGSADIRAIYNGYSIDIEIKKGSDKLNQDQEYFKERIESAKGQYWEVRTFDEFLNHWNYFTKF